MRIVAIQSAKSTIRQTSVVPLTHVDFAHAVHD
jgi:hypothetical protein